MKKYNKTNKFKHYKIHLTDGTVVDNIEEENAPVSKSFLWNLETSDENGILAARNKERVITYIPKRSILYVTSELKKERVEK